MSAFSLDEFKTTYLCGEQLSMFGPYQRPDSTIPTVIVASIWPPVVEVSLCAYSHCGVGNNRLIRIEQVVWPEGAEHIYKYVEYDCALLELGKTFSVSDLPEFPSDMTMEANSVDGVWNLITALASLLSKQTVVVEDSSTRDDEYVDEVEGLLKDYPFLTGLDCPDFWTSR